MLTSLPVPSAKPWHRFLHLDDETFALAGRKSSAVLWGAMRQTGWHDGELAVQRRAGVTAHERLRSAVREALPPHFVDFLLVQRFVILATCDAAGRPWCSMVAGWPGFASAPDPRTVRLDRGAS
jgi:hypothetical protein